MSRYENQFFDYFTRVARQTIARPLTLGGYSYSGGGDGGPPGGYLGVLPQTRIAYDYTEDNTNNGFVNPSGYTLLDNLNHIRYNIKDLQDDVAAIVVSGNMGVTIEHNGVIVAEHVLVVDTTGYLTATDDGGGHVTLDVTTSGADTPIYVASGVFNENVYNGILSTAQFNTSLPFNPDTLAVYWNGVRADPTTITVIDSTTFQTEWWASGTDRVNVDYETMVLETAGGGGTMNHSVLSNLDHDDHPQYLTSGRSDLIYYRQDYIDGMFAGTIMDADYDAKGTLIVGSGYQTPVALHIGANGTVLVADSTKTTGMWWTNISGLAGVTLLSELDDVSITTTPVQGQSLAYNATIARWVPSGIAGTPANSVSLFLPDADPTGPDAQNDEFSNSSLSVSWTEWDYADRCTIVEQEWGLEVVQGYYITGGFGGVYKATPGGSTWTVETKVSLGHSYVASGLAGIMLLENPISTSGRGFFWGPVKTASGARIETSLWSSYNTPDTTFYANTWAMPGHEPIYLRVVKCGTDQYQFWSSFDGFAWSCIYNGSLVAFNPTYIGLVAGNFSFIDVGAIFHFYRVKNNYTSNAHEPTYGRRITI